MLFEARNASRISQISNVLLPYLSVAVSVSQGSAIVKGGASGKRSKRHGGDGSSQERDGETDASKDEDSEDGDREMEGRGAKKKHLKDKNKEKKKKKSKEEKEKAKGTQDRGNSDRHRAGRRIGAVKGARYEGCGVLGQAVAPVCVHVVGVDWSGVARTENSRLRYVIFLTIHEH